MTEAQLAHQLERAAAEASGRAPPKRVYADAVEELMCYMGWDAEFMPPEWANGEKEEVEGWRAIARLYLYKARSAHERALELERNPNSRGAPLERLVGDLDDRDYKEHDLVGAKGIIEREMFPNRHGSQHRDDHFTHAASYLKPAQRSAAQISAVTLQAEHEVAAAGTEDRHVEYVLKVMVRRPPAGGQNFVPFYFVRKRFKQIHKLKESITKSISHDTGTRAAFGEQHIGVAADKKRWSKFSEQNLGARRVNLSAWLAKCSAAPSACVLNTPVMSSFLGVRFWHAADAHYKKALAAELQEREGREVSPQRRAHGLRLLRFVRAVARRNQQIERVQSMMRAKLARFAELLNRGLEVLKFPSQPSCNPRVRVLWLHPDGLLCLGREATVAVEGQPTRTTKRPGKAIRLESLASITEGAQSVNFEQSPRFLQELQEKPENGQFCLSIYGNSDAQDPSFHLRLPSLAAREMLARKLLDIMSEMAAARLLGAAAARAQACAFARSGRFLSKELLKAIVAATFKGAVAGPFLSGPNQVAPPPAPKPPKDASPSAARPQRGNGGSSATKLFGSVSNYRAPAPAPLPHAHAQRGTISYESDDQSDFDDDMSSGEEEDEKKRS